MNLVAVSTPGRGEVSWTRCGEGCLIILCLKVFASLLVRIGLLWLGSEMLCVLYPGHHVWCCHHDQCPQRQRRVGHGSQADAGGGCGRRAPPTIIWSMLYSGSTLSRLVSRHWPAGSSSLEAFRTVCMMTVEHIPLLLGSHTHACNSAHRWWIQSLCAGRPSASFSQYCYDCDCWMMCCHPHGPAPCCSV